MAATAVGGAKQETIIERAVLSDIFFIEQTCKEYAKMISAISNRDIMDQVLQGFHSLPTTYNQIKMWDLNGTITTPWLGGDHEKCRK